MIFMCTSNHKPLKYIINLVIKYIYIQLFGVVCLSCVYVGDVNATKHISNEGISLGI